MSQEDVIKILEKAKKPMTRKEIEKEFPYNRNTLVISLRQLAKHGEIIIILGPIPVYKMKEQTEEIAEKLK